MHREAKRVLCSTILVSRLSPGDYTELRVKLDGGLPLVLIVPTSHAAQGVALLRTLEKEAPDADELPSRTRQLAWCT